MCNFVSNRPPMTYRRYYGPEGRIIRRPGDAMLDLTVLSQPERDVLAVVLDGRTSAKAIAVALAIKPKRAEYLKCSILRKTGVHSTVDLLRRALTDPR
jgi:DNA-binding CsgD family transcriptional regulator